MRNDWKWRVPLGLGGVLLLIGGSLHPRGGSMESMLVDPNWPASHIAQLIAYTLFTLSVISFRRSAPRSPAVHRWSGLAAIGLVLQTIEMAFHTAARADAAHLLGGEATPILSLHMALAVVIYPLFAILMIGLMVTAARTRELGNPWIVWLGVLGLIGHGLAAPLVIGFGIGVAGIGFPMVMLFALWAVLASLMPSRAPA